MKTPLLRLMLLFVLVSACRKSQPDDAAVTTGQPETVKTGNITGTFAPYTGTGATVTISPYQQSAAYVPLIDQNGNFRFTGLPAGTYTLSFQANARYAAPGPRTVTVIGGQDVNAGSITLSESTLNGTISGKVSPAGAATFVSATSNDPLNYWSLTTAVDASTGSFKFTNVPPATYSIGFIAADKMAPPATTALQMAAGQQIDAGTYSFTPYGHLQVLACKVNGTGIAFAGTASYLANTLTLTGAYQQGFYNEAGTRTYRLTIKLDNVTGPGTYLCSSTTTSVTNYSMAIAMTIGGSGSWTSQKGAGNVTVVITSIDAVAHTVSGTFSGTVVTNTGLSSPDQVITEGTFTSPYQ